MRKVPGGTWDLTSIQRMRTEWGGEQKEHHRVLTRMHKEPSLGAAGIPEARSSSQGGPGLWEPLTSGRNALIRDTQPWLHMRTNRGTLKVTQDE